MTDTRRCRACGQPFTPALPEPQATCSLRCAERAAWRAERRPVRVVPPRKEGA